MSHQAMSALPFIDEARIESVLEWDPLMDVLEQSLIAFSQGKVAQPARQIVPVPGRDAIIAAMPAVGKAMAVKIVTLYHSNAGTALPTHQGVIVVFDKVFKGSDLLKPSKPPAAQDVELQEI